jgi:FlaG/FlaF family flagellin (archaellin)
MVRFKKQLRRCRKAVSEIIGNLLILAITVTLFSSIMFYVATIPSPQEQTYAEMTYDLGNVVDSSRWIYLTHKGGQELINGSTNIYIFKYGSELISLKLADGTLSGTDPEKWSPGEVWQYELTGVSGDTPLSVVIIDTKHDTKVWEAEMVGGQVTGDYAPVITTRGTMPSIVIDGSPFRFYASVSDFNGDLDTNSVYVDATSLGLTPALVHLTDSDGDGVFTSGELTGNKNFDNKEVMVKAIDLTSKAASSKFTIIAQQDLTGGGGGSNETNIGPFTGFESYLVNGTYPPNASGGQSGNTQGTTFYYIRRASDKVITREFTPGEALYVEIYSNKLTNLALENSFSLFNPTTGSLMTPPTKLVNAFQYGGIFATFHRYYINLTAPAQPLYFPLQISLRDTTGTVVNIADSISVTGANYPIIKTYKLNSATSKLELCNSFNHTDTVYLKVFTKDVDSAITTVVINDMQINDYSGKYVVKQTMPSPTTWTSGVQPALATNAPLSQIYKTAKTGTSPNRVYDNVVLNAAYTVQIDLLRPNYGWWLPGKNSYTLYIPVLTDSGSYGTGETYYNMNYQFNVTAPRSTTDLVASIGSGSFTWSASGAAWENNKLVWYKNGERFDQWDATIIDDDTYDGPIGMELADLDNDGYKDLIVGFQDSTVSIAWYRNQKIDGSAWSTLPYLICNAFDAYPGTQASANTDQGLNNEDSTVWATQYNPDRFASSTYSSVNEIVGAIKSGDFDGDGDIDVVASFTHSVVYTTASGSGDADYTNSYGMFFNRGIYVFWNDGSWTRTQLYGTNVYTNQNNNPAALDMAVADLNQDGVDDIIAVYETGVTSIWMNQWKQVIGISSTPKVDAFGSGSLVPAANVPTVTGTNPWDHVQRLPSVTIADVDLNGYPDIIRTSSTASGSSRTVTVIRTMPSTPTDLLRSPSAEYSPAAETSAQITGTMSNLVGNDGTFETLTEVYKNTGVIVGIPDQKQVSVPNIDDTGQDLNNLKYDDGVTYNVGSLKTMHVRSFAVDSTYSSKPLTQVLLHVDYSSTANYNGNKYLQYSVDGTNFLNTNFLPTSSTLGVNGTFDLKAAGIDTWAELQNLRVMFVHNGLDGTVQFDYIRLEVKFAESRWMEWQYEVPNLPAQLTHQLGIAAYTTGESFKVQYSTDGTIWYDAFSFDETVKTLKQIQLPHTTNSEYFIKIIAMDTSTSDTFNDTLYVDLIGIRHISPTVYWPSSETRTVSFTMQNNAEYITALAVADVGSSLNNLPDNYPDIIVGTSYVGSGSVTSTLMLSFGNGNSFSAPEAITTAGLSAAVGGNNALYNTQAITVGDFNGDGYKDLAVIIGFAPGRDGGTAPTVWLYRNDPSVGQWGEQVLNALAAGESAINVQAGNVDLTILYPLLGVLGLVAVEGWMSRTRRKRE